MKEQLGKIKFYCNKCGKEVDELHSIEEEGIKLLVCDGCRFKRTTINIDNICPLSHDTDDGNNR